MLFLGAGASVPFGKPTTAEFKKKITYFEGFFSHFLNYEKFIDIEHILQCLYDLRGFTDTEYGKFLNHLSNMGYIKYGFGNQVQNSVFSSNVFPTLSQELNKVEEVVNKVENDIFETYRWDVMYDNDLKIIYGYLLNFLKENSDELIIATTNYDKSIERICDFTEYDYNYIDGFRFIKDKFLFTDDGFYIPPEYDPKQNIILYKLHGSLGWKLNLDKKIERTHEENKPIDSNYGKNCIIYPTLSPKEEECKPPFNAIISEFKKKLNQTDVCIVIGFSFRDKEISKMFKNFVKDGKMLIIIDELAEENIVKNMNDQKEFQKSDTFSIQVPIKEENNTVGNAYVIKNYIKNDLEVLEGILDTIYDITGLINFREMSKNPP